MVLTIRSNVRKLPTDTGYGAATPISAIAELALTLTGT